MARQPRGTTTEDIYSACKDGDELYVKQWANHPENDVNSTDQHGFTPLHYACMHGQTNIIDFLLNRGCRIDITNMGGDSLLHVAAAFGKYEVVLKLLRNQIDPNPVNEHGNTPLHYAAFWNYIGICEVLVKHGALVVLANKYGKTPYNKARPTLRRKLQMLADEYGQSLVAIPYKKPMFAKRKEFLEFRQRQMEIEPRQVTLSLKLKEDVRQELWKGSWSGHTVMIKKLKAKEDVFSSQTVQETFPREYPRLRILTHENISPLLAVVLEPQIHLVSIHFPLGTLYHILHDIDTDVRINLQEGVKLAKDICCGMGYIHSMESLTQRFELNPHHVVVDDDLTAKLDLSTYRFSFMSASTITYPQWYAPEALQRRPEDIDRKAAHMYSFAMVLWEIASGKIPFDGIPPMRAGIMITREHARPIVPQYLNSHLQRIIDICWNADPSKRPKFERIEPILDKLNVT